VISYLLFLTGSQLPPPGRHPAGWLAVMLSFSRGEAIRLSSGRKLRVPLGVPRTGVYVESLVRWGYTCVLDLLASGMRQGTISRSERKTVHSAMLRITHMKRLYVLELGRILYGERRSFVACKELELS